MSDKDDKAKDVKKTEKVQAFLTISSDGSAPKMECKLVGEESYPANMVKLPGVVLEVCDPTADVDDWEAANKLVEMCRMGEALQENTDHIEDNLGKMYDMLEDMISGMDRNLPLGNASTRTLLSQIQKHVVDTGKCIGIDVEDF